MKIYLFGFAIAIERQAPAPAHFHILRGPQMTEDELTSACKVDAGDPLWMATNQLIDTLINNCRLREWETVENASRVAGYIGGAEHLEQLRDDLQRRRNESLAAFRRSIRRQKRGEDGLPRSAENV